MKLVNLIKTFRDDESGAVTVDWVVLTAAIVGLGIAVITAVSGGVTSLGSNIATALENDDDFIGAGTGFEGSGSGGGGDGGGDENG